jgi:hypothetical protein
MDESQGLCKHKSIYIEKYDGYACLICGEWMEKQCSDPQCEYCKDRPEDAKEEIKDEL